MVFADTRAHGLLVGENLNAPVGGVRPLPGVANVIRERVSRTVADTHVVDELRPQRFERRMMGLPTSSGPRFAWRRGLGLNVGYTIGKWENNVDGAFSVPASGSLDSEWGPSSNDVRHRVVVSLMSGAVKNLNVMMYVQGSTATPYTVRTGIDDNGDLMFNDRPIGVGTQHGARGRPVDVIRYVLVHDRARQEEAAGRHGHHRHFVRSRGCVDHAGQLWRAVPLSRGVQPDRAEPDQPPNYVGYSGVMTSPFFRKPTMVEGVRTMNLGISVSF